MIKSIGQLICTKKYIYFFLIGDVFLMAARLYVADTYFCITTTILVHSHLLSMMDHPPALRVKHET